MRKFYMQANKERYIVGEDSIFYICNDRSFFPKYAIEGKKKAPLEKTSEANFVLTKKLRC